MLQEKYEQQDWWLGEIETEKREWVRAEKRAVGD